MTKHYTGRAVTILLTAALAGCGTAPGMFMTTPASTQPRSTWFGGRASEPEPTIDFSVIRLGVDNMDKYGPSASTSSAPMPSSADAGPYRLGLQDVLRVSVWGQPDFSPTISSATNGGLTSAPLGRTINEDGKLFFPLVGSLKAAGLTIPEFRAALTKALTKYIKDPQVDVDVAAFRSQRMFVVGEVRSPMALPITDIPLKMNDAIAAVGGPSPDADLAAVQLNRGNQRFTLDLNRLFYGGDFSLNFTLLPGDVLTIPDRQANKVFMLGELMAPRTFPLRRGRVSLGEVLAEAGGPNLSANAGEVFVMRLDPAGKPQVFQLDAREPIALLLADRFDMRSRDLVYVNPTGATHALRIMNQYLPLLQGVSSAKQVGGF